MPYFTIRPMWISLAVMMCVFCCAPGFAQDSSDARSRCVILLDAEGFAKDAGDIFGAPFHFDTGQWLATASIVAGTAAFFAVDEPARRVAQSNQSRLGDDVFGVGKEYGRASYGLALSAGLYVGGLVFKSGETRETGVILLESLAFAGAITTVLKSVFGRSRPYTGEGAFRYRGFQFKAESTSLPSGHTTVAFAVSSVLAGRLKNPFATVGLYSMATLTALSRVYHDAHWVSDNILAAAIGTVVGLALVDLHEQGGKGVELRIVPSTQGLRAELLF